MIIRELLGTVASLLVVFSYTLVGIKLRLVNIIGSILFVIYGIMIGGISIVVLNGITIPIHLYYIMKEVKSNNERSRRQS